MSELRDELRELTDRELDAIGGGLFNVNGGQTVQFNNTLNTVGNQIGNQFNGLFSVNGIFV